MLCGISMSAAVINSKDKNVKLTKIGKKVGETIGQ